MHKPFLSFFLALVICGMSAAAPTASARTFSDVSGTVFARAFGVLGEAGIVQGFADGTARPLQFLTRAEAVKLLVAARPQWQARVRFFTQNPSPIALFRDVPQTHWVTPYLETAFTHGLITGYADGTFLPDMLLTNEEAIVLLARAYGDTAEGSEALDSPYLANVPGTWYTSSFNVAIAKNLVLPQRQIVPGYVITRGQFIDMVYRRYELARTGKSVFLEENQPLKQLPLPAAKAVLPPSDKSPVPSANVQVSNTQYVMTNTSAQIPNPNPNPNPSFSLTIPALGLTQLPVLHPSDPFTDAGLTSVLKNGIGHLFSYPGAGGKIMLYGHSSAYPWDLSEYARVFRTIHKLQTGDTIELTYQGKVHKYQVTGKETVDASDTTPFKDNGSGEELLLYTCWPLDSIQQRYIVRARPV